jgi:hypothetical protein
MNKEEENQIEIKKLVELIYEMYLKDLSSGNLVNEPAKSFGKICKKKNPLKNIDGSRLFYYGN